VRSGTRVELAPLRPADSPALFAWINDRELVTLSAPFRPVSQEEHDAWFDDVRSRDDVRIFGIRLDDGDRLVGTCQLTGIHPLHRSAELRIRLGERGARGKGVGTEAVRLLLAVGFDQLELHRIFLHVFATNEPARRLYEHAGFRTEGVMREAVLIEGEWLDVVFMAMLRSEYESTR
jgi:RimJ/RimL family protein N-acetyltransferase